MTFEGIQLFVPLMEKNQKPLAVKSVCYLKSFCFELITLILTVIYISSVWKMFLVVAFYSVWYFGSV